MGKVLHYFLKDSNLIGKGGVALICSGDFPAVF